MEQTANYGLNQWNKSDRIQMEDFNADNVKTDQALAALENGQEVLRSENRLVRLGEWSFDEDTNSISFPLPEQWYSNYWKLYIIGDLQTSNPAAFSLFVNEEADSRFTVASGANLYGRAQIEVTPFNSVSATYVNASVLTYKGPDETPSSPGGSGCISDLPPAELLSVGLRMSASTYRFKEGSHFTLYGLR